MSGITNSNRVDTLGYQLINKKVVDTILNGRTYGSRHFKKGKAWSTGKSFDIPMAVTALSNGEWFTGMETLSTAASDPLITLSYTHTAYAQPAVSIALESFANAGSQGQIDVDTFNLEYACANAIQALGLSAYGTGTGGSMLGLGAVVDDGTDVGTIGGQSRTTYTILRATRTAASGGALSFSLLATLNDAISGAGMESEEPNIHVTTKTVWTLYESLLTPQQRNNYDLDGGSVLPLTGDEMVRKAGGTGGFTALGYRGRPVIKDDACTSGNWFQLNEKYFNWMGRTTVPSEYKDVYDAVSFNHSTLDGVPASSDYAPGGKYGWFYEKYAKLPNQEGKVARYVVIGQTVASQFRRQGRNTGITTV